MSLEKNKSEEPFDELRNAFKQSAKVNNILIVFQKFCNFLKT